MMGRNHLVVGACALGHAYAAEILIDRADIAPLTTVKEVTQSYLGISGMNQENVLVYMTANLLVVYLIAFFIGTLLPDIDSPNSLLGRYIHIPVEHRTWLHAIYLYLIPAVLGWFVHPVFSWLFFGVFVHLFWDSLSASGNCWLYKLASEYKEYGGGAKIKKHHVLKLYHTGGWSEYILVVLITGATVGLFMLIGK